MPMLAAIEDEYIRQAPNYKALTVNDIPAEFKPGVMRWIAQLRGDMAATKMAASQFAEVQMDDALLPYHKQYGFDTIANIAFPYQFWYTRTMLNYARRVFEKPAMFAWYYRYRKAQKKMQAEGVPGRLFGKMRIPAAWLPRWYGGGLWIDPMRQIFPFSQFLDPVNYAVQLQNAAKYATFRVLNEMMKDKLISQQEADQARTTMSGPAWEQAYAVALQESDVSDPMTLASMMMTPGMYLTIPYYAAIGKPEKIQPTPMLRTSQAYQAMLKGTVAEPIGNVIGAFGAPERWIREQVMTPGKAMFGEFGDYYIGRNLANMIANNEISIDEALQGISLHEGGAYDLGLERTKEEIALRTPGLLPILAIKNSASIPDIAFSVLVSLFPAGLLPKGELEYLKDKDDYSRAWELYKLGYKKELSDFFNEHPEYEARIALKAEPEEQLRQFLVSEIWDRYYELDSVNKKEVANQFGQLFKERFLEGETRNYEGISLETLARWSYQIGGYLPQTSPELEGLRQSVQEGEVLPADLWSPEIAAAYTKYQEERDSKYPNYYAIQDQYYKLPSGSQRKAFLRQFPELKEYWDWKHKYAQDHPEIQGIMESKRAEQQSQPQGMDQAILDNMQPELVEQLMTYFMVGENMTPGAWMALQRIWEQNGSPYDDIGTWIERELQPAFK